MVFGSFRPLAWLASSGSAEDFKVEAWFGVLEVLQHRLDKVYVQRVEGRVVVPFAKVSCHKPAAGSLTRGSTGCGGRGGWRRTLRSYTGRVRLRRASWARTTPIVGVAQLPCFQRANDSTSIVTASMQILSGRVGGNGKPQGYESQ